MTRLVSTLALFLGVTTALVAQVKASQASKQVAWWRSSWEKGIAEARDRNVPVVVVIIQDEEEANERLVDGLLPDPMFVQATEATVAIVCSKKDHGIKRIPAEGGGEIAVCTRFGGVPCSAHQSHEFAMFHEFYAGKEVKTPAVLVCTLKAEPDEEGRLLDVTTEIIDVYGTSTYVDAIRKAAAKLGPGLTRKQYEEAQQAVTRARNLFKSGELAESWTVLVPLQAMGGKSSVVRAAVELQSQIISHVDEAVGKAETAAAAGDLWTAVATLDGLKAAFKDTPPGERAAKSYNALTRSKEAKAVASALQKQKRYEPDFVKASEYERVGDWLTARTHYERIAKKAKDLPIATRAKARVEAMKADPVVAKIFAAEADRRFAAAEKLEAKGKTDRARKLYAELASDLPETEAGRAAAAKVDG